MVITEVDIATSVNSICCKQEQLHFCLGYSHGYTVQVRLSVFQADMLRSYLQPYGQAEVNGFVIVYTHLPLIRSGKKMKKTVSFSTFLDINVMDQM